MPEITYATVCSGVECMSEAVRPLGGWRPVFFSEVAPFPCAVLKARYPDVPNLGDMTKIRAERVFAGKWRVTNGAVDIELDGRLGCLAGGTPCTDVSVAGRREGMAEGSGTRSSLAFEFARLCGELQPRWVLWENVPGVLTSNGGRDFARFARTIGECGYSVAYRTLDAQYARVDGFPRAIPQRRRRVWLVGHLGADDLAAAEVLLESARACGDTPPRRLAGAEAARADGAGRRVHGHMVETAFAKVNHAWGKDGLGERWAETDVASTRNTFETGDVRSQEVVVAERDEGAVCVLNFQGSKSNCAVTADGSAPTLTAGHGTDAHVVAGDLPRAASCSGGDSPGEDGIAAMRYIVRRITPVEAERLMGLPDNYTIPAMTVTDALVREFMAVHDRHAAIAAAYAGRKPPRPASVRRVSRWLERICDPETCPDSPRYRACGNGWAVNCARWVCGRIAQHERKEKSE